MTRALRIALPLSLLFWGAIAWFAPEVVLALGIGAVIAVAADVTLDW